MGGCCSCGQQQSSRQQSSSNRGGLSTITCSAHLPLAHLDQHDRLCAAGGLFRGGLEAVAWGAAAGDSVVAVSVRFEPPPAPNQLLHTPPHDAAAHRATTQPPPLRSPPLHPHPHPNSLRLPPSIIQRNPASPPPIRARPSAHLSRSFRDTGTTPWSAATRSRSVTSSVSSPVHLTFSSSTRCTWLSSMWGSKGRIILVGWGGGARMFGVWRFFGGAGAGADAPALLRARFAQMLLRVCLCCGTVLCTGFSAE